MAAPAQGRSSSEVKVLSEEGVLPVEMHKQLREFLRRDHVMQGLSSDDHARLRALRNALQQDTQRQGDTVKTK